jgi:hypothetical protein
MIKITVSNFYEDCPPEYKSSFNSNLQGSCWQCNETIKAERFGYIMWQHMLEYPSRIINILWFCSKKHRKQWIEQNNRPEEMEIFVNEPKA